MARIVCIDTETLSQTKATLDRIQNAFTEPEEGSYQSPEDRAEDIGPGFLVDKARDYGKDCKQNYERQSEDLGALAQAIDPVIEAFKETDEELCNSLESEE
ncbi:hypothetical protein [Nocardiopsis sp. NPDC006938]|uniref:hypothetical protein n=1 Tax=Nocardiopsis sp. NPDC006938 TaxID=3364337 RepID=UPI003687A6C2